MPFWNGTEFETSYAQSVLTPIEFCEDNGRNGFHTRLVDTTENQIIIDGDVGVMNTLLLSGGTCPQYNNTIADTHFEEYKTRMNRPDITKEEIEFVFVEYTTMPKKFEKRVKEIVKDEIETEMIQRGMINRFGLGYCCRRIGNYMAMREKKRFSKKNTLKIGSLGIREKNGNEIMWLFGNGGDVRTCETI
jgi:hypothetical protein